VHVNTDEGCAFMTNEVWEKVLFIIDLISSVFDKMIVDEFYSLFCFGMLKRFGCDVFKITI
jgi:hypothetical protein